MPKAVRIHHPTLRNCVYTVTDLDRPYLIPHDCSICGQQHPYKTYHMNLNEHGDVCVSQEVYEIFKQRGLAEQVTATKEVTPAPMTISMAQTGVVRRDNGYDIAQVQPIPAPPYVYNRERGLMEPPDRNLAWKGTVPYKMPVGMYYKNPDGTWTEVGHG